MSDPTTTTIPEGSKKMKPTEQEKSVAKAICKAAGDDWLRDGPRGLVEAYLPLARAAINAIQIQTK